MLTSEQNSRLRNSANRLWSYLLMIFMSHVTTAQEISEDTRDKPAMIDMFILGVFVIISAVSIAIFKLINFFK